MQSQITEFVHDALARGVSREDIRRGLLEGGWSEKEIHVALEAFADCGLPLPVPRKKVSGSAKEAFLYLMLFSAMYTTVFALCAVLFDLINIYLPDPGESVQRWILSLRSGIATVVVAFPIWLLMSRVVRGETVRNPGQRIAPVRRWLTYLTLFVASASIVADMITLVVRFLSGDLTLRFGLKVAVVAVAAGIVLVHYLRDLRRDEVAPSAEYRPAGRAKWATAALVAFVLAVIGLGFWTSGSPMEARLYLQDDQRVRDLAEISRKVQLYYANHGALPASLDDCDIRPETYIEWKTDRVSGEPYGYRVIDEARFEVSATFTLPSTEPVLEGRQFPGPSGPQGPYGPGGSGFWRHGKGRTAFEVDATKKFPQ